MKKLAVAAVAILSAVQAQAQQETFLSKVRLEAGYGYNQALSPDNVDRTDVSGVNTLQLGANYQINSLWGVRGTYSNTTFKHKDVDDAGINYNKLTAEAVFEVLQAIRPSESKFQLAAHAGFGLNFGKSKATDVNDNIGNFQIGLMPKYNITSRIGVFLDGTYIMNFSQNLGYNGLSIPGEDSTTGSYATALIGVSFKLGQ